MGWASWKEDLSGILDPNIDGISIETADRFHEAVEWIFRRPWPEGHSNLKMTIQTLGRVVNDFLVTLNAHIELWQPTDTIRMVRTSRFYKLDTWDPPRYHRLLKEHEEHVELLQDLVLEVTRYSNYIIQQARDQVDSSYCDEQGWLVVMMGPLGFDLRYDTFKPTFSDQDFEFGQPYRGKEQFRQDRLTRSLRAGED
jgi:hypothetical protein